MNRLIDFAYLTNFPQLSDGFLVDHVFLFNTYLALIKKNYAKNFPSS